MSTAVKSAAWLVIRYQPNYKWFLALVVVVVLAIGWRFPAFGFIVPVAMAAGMGGGFLRGRWVCGNLCPRGSLLDTWFGSLNRRSVPDWMTRPAARWSVLVVLIGFMVAQLTVDPGNWQHWGIVFWRICLITTVAAVGLAATYTPRGWCRICPVGTVVARVGGDRQPLQIASACRACNRCEQACPMQFAIADHHHIGQLSERDCLKCSICIKACPSQILSWPVSA